MDGLLLYASDEVEGEKTKDEEESQGTEEDSKRKRKREVMSDSVNGSPPPISLYVDEKEKQDPKFNSPKPPEKRKKKKKKKSIFSQLSLPPPLQPSENGEDRFLSYVYFPVFFEGCCAHTVSEILSSSVGVPLSSLSQTCWWKNREHGEGGEKMAWKGNREEEKRVAADQTPNTTERNCLFCDREGCLSCLPSTNEMAVTPPEDSNLFSEWDMIDTLHISVSKPFSLSKKQIFPFIHSLESFAPLFDEPIVFSFSSWKCFSNENSSKTFLAIVQDEAEQVEERSEEEEKTREFFEKIVVSVDSILEKFGFPTYFSSPEIHASILSTKGQFVGSGPLKKRLVCSSNILCCKIGKVTYRIKLHH